MIKGKRAQRQCRIRNCATKRNRGRSLNYQYLRNGSDQSVRFGGIFQKCFTPKNPWARRKKDIPPRKPRAGPVSSFRGGIFDIELKVDCERELPVRGIDKGVVARRDKIMPLCLVRPTNDAFGRQATVKTGSPLPFADRLLSCS